ncbi:MAG: ABC transporter substrate-binding protein [Pseudomonadales bacterium]|jgi:iron complex transport system substrate-binding protein|nr:ABC transporter substrate-binding protein [Pseudomonadales bacterium]
MPAARPVCCLVLFLVASLSAAAEERIVAIGGAVTEIVFALGAGDRLVAVDSTSSHPPAAKDLPDVGYLRRLAPEPIIALAPSIVLALEDAGPPAVLDQLRAAGVPLVIVPDAPTPDSVIDKVRVVAEALGRVEEGNSLMARLASDFAALTEAPRSPESPRVLLLLAVSASGAPLVGGEGTSADAIIRLAGARNAAAGVVGYKPLAPEAVVALAPDVLLIPDRGLELLGGRDRLLSRPEIAPTPAGQAGRIVTMDQLLLLGFGPRTPEAAQQLSERLTSRLAGALP